MTAEVIWRYLTANGLTLAGAAGLMGNLQAESRLDPRALEVSKARGLGYNDSSYTAAVDSGAYGNFVRDAAGYGLAQWTYHTRKQALLNFARSSGRSIGDLGMQLEFLMNELRSGYGSVLNVLTRTGSVREASDVVLTQFERPKDQGEGMKQKRAGLGQQWYNRFAGGPAPQPSRGGGNDSGLIERLAREVIRGNWGNGQDRKNRLAAAGYDYAAVQRRVNEILTGHP